MWGGVFDRSEQSEAPRTFPQYKSCRASLGTRTRASGATCLQELLAVRSTSTKHVQDAEVHHGTRMTGRARIIRADVPINSNPFAEVKSFSQTHSHVEQRSDEIVGTSGYKKLRIQPKPVLLKHGPESGPNGSLVVLGREQIAEMTSASETPVRGGPPQHYSVGTEGDAIVEAVWVRGIGPSFGFEERRMKIAPIDANVTIVIRRLKA
jgi:hypothetical protein